MKKLLVPAAVVFALSGGNYFGAVVAEYHRAHGLFAQGRLRDYGRGFWAQQWRGILRLVGRA